MIREVTEVCQEYAIGIAVGAKDTVVSMIRYAISKVFPWIPSADNWITHRENIVADPKRAIGMALLEAEMMYAKGQGCYGVQAGNCKCQTIKKSGLDR